MGVSSKPSTDEPGVAAELALHDKEGELRIRNHARGRPERFVMISFTIMDEEETVTMHRLPVFFPVRMVRLSALRKIPSTSRVVGDLPSKIFA